jgi:hypothetical protein
MPTSRTFDVGFPKKPISASMPALLTNDPPVRRARSGLDGQRFDQRNCEISNQ